jgi:hypothetical protein
MPATFALPTFLIATKLVPALGFALGQKAVTVSKLGIVFIIATIPRIHATVNTTEKAQMAEVK